MQRKTSVHSFRSSALRLGLAALVLGLAAPVRAQPQPVRLRITLQPDCYRPSLTAACDKRKTKVSDNPLQARLDLGPQIAIWLERADGTFVDTVLVTNLTAVLGLGNRPGYSRLPSSPKFPYGKRPMVLPVWAHKRGKTYDTTVMQDGVDREYWLGFHESSSSPDPYYCRPVTYDEIDVDAISCPTQRFNSVKGRFFDPATELAPQHLKNGVPEPYVPPPKVYYPPRNDLTVFTDNDCSHGGSVGTCMADPKKYAELNDLDLVASATPPYGRPFSKLWRVPDDLPEGDYVLFLEISKEFDNNASHAYPSRSDEMLMGWGLLNNFGQPSVVFKVPFALSRSAPAAAATSQIAGYGDPLGETGTLHAPDSTISDAPGSGSGRLLSITSTPSAGAAPVSGRVIVTTEIGMPVEPPPPPPPLDGGAGGVDGGDAGGPSPDGPAPAGCPLSEAPALELAIEKVDAEEALISFVEPTGAVWDAIDEYEIKRWSGATQSVGAFSSGMGLLPVPRQAPGAKVMVRVPDLKSQHQYNVGVRAHGACGQGLVGYGNFTTPLREFTMLSGCFVATAAYGSPLARDVALLRRVRDRAAGNSAVAAAAADVYGRSSPPVANLIGRSQPARAVARRMLAPLVEVARAFDWPRAAPPRR
jgi:hypothetical protein